MATTVSPALFAPFQSFAAKLRTFCRLVGVVLLQDMRTRYGSRNLLGYGFTVAIPLFHLAVITTLYYLRTMVAPVGDSPTLFIATGALPYIVCVYPAREMTRAVIDNRQLLNIPLLLPIHLMASRCLLEMLNAMFVMAVFVFALYLFDVDIAPIDLVEAAKATGAAIFLGVGFGLFNVMMCGVVGQFFQIVFILTTISLFMVSGVYIPTWSMPEDIRGYIEYNPIYQLVEWVRSAYFTSYDMQDGGKIYVLGQAGVFILTALLGERLFRGRFLS